MMSPSLIGKGDPEAHPQGFMLPIALALISHVKAQHGFF